MSVLSHIHSISSFLIFSSTFFIYEKPLLINSYTDNSGGEYNIALFKGIPYLKSLQATADEKLTIFTSSFSLVNILFGFKLL